MFALEKLKASAKVTPTPPRRRRNSKANDLDSDRDLVSTASSIRSRSDLVLSFAQASSSDEDDEEEETKNDYDDDFESLVTQYSVSFPVHKAACVDSVESLRLLLSQGSHDLETWDDSGCAPLHQAAKCDNAAIIDALLDFGAKVDARDRNGWTPLYHATRSNSLRAVNTLLARHADINFQNPTSGVRALHTAIFTSTQEICERLLADKHCDVNLTAAGGMAPIHLASMRGDLAICRSLVQRGARVMVRTLDGLTPLHYAASTTDGSITTLLINSALETEVKYPMHLPAPETGINKLKEFVDSRDAQINSPLHIAAQSGNLAAIEVLSKHGAELNAMNSNLRTPLHLAAFNGHYQVLEALLTRGAAVNLKDEQQQTALHRAVASGHTKSAMLLVAHGAAVEAKDSEGQPPLLTAITAGQFDCVDLLVKLKADVHTRDKRMRCCLHVAAQKEHADILKLLLEKVGSLMANMGDCMEKTVLHYAAVSSNVQILKLVLQYNACCMIKDMNHKTALHVAVEMGKVNHVEAMCRAALSCISLGDDAKRTPLHYAVINRKKRVMSMLICMGAETDVPDINGWTPLMWAAASGSVSITKLLLSHRVNQDHVNRDGHTALHMAANHGHVHIVQLLLDHGAQLLKNNCGMTLLDVAMARDQGTVLMATVRHDRWREVLTASSPDSSSRFAKLIEKFPAAAAVVMDHCVQRSVQQGKVMGAPTTTYDFHLLDPGPTDQDEPRKVRFSGLSKMVEHRQEDLLMHPLAMKLLETKWSVFGLYSYWFNFFTYVLFLAPLTAFILEERSEVALPDPAKNNATQNQKVFLTMTPFNAIIPYVVTALAIIHLVKEIGSIYIQGVRYFLLVTNLLEWCLYVMSLLFMAPYLIPDTGLRSRPELYWQMGTCAVFFGYLNFILFLRTFDYFGLYVTMFFEVLKSVTKAMVVFSLFLFVFALVFHILLKEEEAFSNFPMAFVKATVMTIGELEYSAMLVDSLYQTNQKSQAPLVPYPEFSFAFFFLFMIAMPIVLVNLLVGLAVGDIEAIRKTAFIRNKARKIAFVTEFEESLPWCFARRLYRERVKETEGEAETRWRKLQKLLGLWNTEEAQPFEDENEVRLVALQKEMTKSKQKMRCIAASLAQQREILMAIASNVGAPGPQTQAPGNDES